MIQKRAEESDTLRATRQLVLDSFERQGWMHHLGITVESIEPGEVRLKMPFRPELTQQHGFFHAGGTSALADTAGGYAGFTLFPQDSSVLTVEFKINLVAPARGDYLEAVGKVLRSGRTLPICQLEVHAVMHGKTGRAQV